MGADPVLIQFQTRPEMSKGGGASKHQLFGVFCFGKTEVHGWDPFPQTEECGFIGQCFWIDGLLLDLRWRFVWRWRGEHMAARETAKSGRACYLGVGSYQLMWPPGIPKIGDKSSMKCDLWLIYHVFHLYHDVWPLYQQSHRMRRRSHCCWSSQNLQFLSDYITLFWHQGLETLSMFVICQCFR